jgi:hypothetical protein
VSPSDGWSAGVQPPTRRRHVGAARGRRHRHRHSGRRLYRTATVRRNRRGWRAILRSFSSRQPRGFGPVGIDERRISTSSAWSSGA